MPKSKIKNHMITKQEIINANKILGCNKKSILEHPLVRDFSDERFGSWNDGIWIYLQDGWCCPSSDCNAFHEDKLSDVVRCLKNAYYDAETLDNPNDTEFKLID